MRLAYNPTHAYLHADPAVLKQRTEALAAKVGGTVVAHDGRVGGGGAPGHPLPGYAVELDEELAHALRRHDPAILGRVHGGRLLIDLRCVPEDQDALVAAAIVEAVDEAAGEVRA